MRDDLMNLNLISWTLQSLKFDQKLKIRQRNGRNKKEIKNKENHNVVISSFLHLKRIIECK